MSQRLNVESVFRTEDLAEAFQTGFVCYDPSMEWEGDEETGFQFFCSWAFDTTKLSVESGEPGPRLFACDELQSMTGTMLPWELKRVIQTGRRWGLDAALVSQQLNEIPNTLRNQCSEVVTFQHSDPYVLDIMTDWGFDPMLVAGLDTGEFLWRDDKGNTAQKKLFDKPRNANTVQKQSLASKPPGTGSPVDESETE